MEQTEEKDFIDYKQYLRIITKFWYVGVAILLLSYIYGFYKVRYATPVYMVNTTLQIKDKSSYSQGSKSFLEGSSMFQPFKNIMNEIELIKSYNRIQLVVKELDFTWEYSVKGNIRDLPVYKSAPFVLDSDSGLIVTNTPIYITIVDPETFMLSVSIPGKQLYDPVLYRYVKENATPVFIDKKKYHFGETISFGLFSFKINKTGFYGVDDIDHEFTLIARDLHYLTKVYKSKMSVTKSDKSSIITIASSGSIVEKEVAFLNKVSEVYVRKELEDKNQIATNTIMFIDSQLGIISDSLNIAENSIQSFKEKNKIYAIGQQAETVMDQLKELESKKLEMEIQLRYYEYLKTYLNTDKELTDLVAPSTINITEGILNQLVAELIALYQEKNTLRYMSSEKSPAYQTILIRIRTTKDALLETTSNLVNTSRSSIADLNSRILKFESQMARIPDKERSLINIQRRHTINDNIYNYLLQKRAEASIARASNLPDAFIVESPREDEYIQIAPTPNKIYMTNLLQGLGLIILLIVVYSRLDKKVHSKEDITSLTGIPVLGTIAYISDKSADKKVQAGYSILTESFRSIRTNLQFMLQGKKTFMIGVTSCISGDGKSFCSQNLARVYALSGKKTLLIKGDLRKIVHARDHQLPDHALGLSEYLIGAATLDQIVYKGDIDNLSIIIPGPVPPNASELFASEQMESFLQKVKQQFEVVILDSPPIGLVSDYMSVMKFVDANLYVIRHEYTPKDSLEVIKEIKSKYHGTASHSVLFNGIKGRLANSYPYGDAYAEEKSRKWWNKII